MKTLNPPNVAPPPPTYRHVAITPISSTSNLITLAGQIGSDPATGQIPGDFLQQVRLAYDNVQNCLAAAGASLRDVISVRHYIVTVTGDSELDQVAVVDRGFGPIYQEMMDHKAGGHRPPDVVVGVAGLAKPEILYEVEAWAIVSKE